MFITKNNKVVIIDNRGKEKLKPAYMRGTKKCVRCGFCCHQRTCIPTPDELEVIAKYLKMTPKACIRKYYGIDYDEVGYFIKPLGENILDLGGKVIPSERTFNEGKCVFLKQGADGYYCQIHEVKPLSAREQKCWINHQSNATDKAKESWSMKISGTTDDGILVKRFGINIEKWI